MGPICLGANESHIYPNMCAIFGYGQTVVSREKGGTGTRTAGMNGNFYGGSATKRIVIKEPSLHATTTSLTFPPLSIARYSFIQLSELGRQRRQRKCPNFETIAKGVRTRAHLIASPAFYR